MDTRKLICNVIKKMTRNEIEIAIETLTNIITEREKYKSGFLCNQNKQRDAFNHYYEATIGSICILYHSFYFETSQYCSFTSTVLFNDEVTTLRKVKTVLDELQKSFKPQETKENE